MSTTQDHGISLHVTVWIAPENREAFLAAAKPIFDAVTAEPENTFFEVFEAADEPGCFQWVENWNQTAEWLMEVQIPKDYYKAYFATTEAMFIKPREFRIYKRLDPAVWTSVSAKNAGVEK